MARIGRQRVKCNWPSVSCWPLPVHPETHPDPVSTSSTESSEDMRSLQACPHLLAPCLMWPLSLLLLIGLSACGPASSDHAPSLEPRASLGGPSESQPASRNSPVTPAASPVPAPDKKDAPAPMPERLVLPQWMATALASPEVPVRLRALDTWAQQGSNAPLDPVVMALKDPDDGVRMKAMAMIEQHWAVAQQAEPPGDEEGQEELPGDEEQGEVRGERERG